MQKSAISHTDVAVKGLAEAGRIRNPANWTKHERSYQKFWQEIQEKRIENERRRQAATILGAQ